MNQYSITLSSKWHPEGHICKPASPWNICEVDGQEGKEFVHTFMTLPLYIHDLEPAMVLLNVRFYTQLLHASFMQHINICFFYWYPIMSWYFSSIVYTKAITTASQGKFHPPLLSCGCWWFCPPQWPLPERSARLPWDFLLCILHRRLVTIRGSSKCSSKFLTKSLREISISSEDSLAKALPPFPVWQFSKNILKPTESPSQWQPQTPSTPWYFASITTDAKVLSFQKTVSLYYSDLQNIFHCLRKTSTHQYLNRNLWLHTVILLSSQN